MSAATRPASLWRLSLVLLLATLALWPAMVLALAQTPAASRPFAGSPAWIAYQTAGADGFDHLGLVHPDGTGDHAIMVGLAGGQLLPDWSPDGSHLVYTSRGGETEPLFVYDIATEEVQQLFPCAAPCVGDDEPVYSPDGTRVAFIRALGPFVPSEAAGGEVPADCGLWVGDLASGEVTQVTSNTDPPCDREYNLRWSPDGTRFTYWRDPYVAGKPAGTSVYVIDADGEHERQLTDPTIAAGSPDWSPDGEWIVYSTYPLSEFQCCQVSNLYRLHPDGSGVEQLTFFADHLERATQPRYAPDGQWILFTHVTPQARSLWAIPAAGGDPVTITPGGIYTHPAWQPTGGA
ncbi:MAG: PD40 domain-containing protein [Thermomicrobiales bacterium]|nr:PD40 domain-containing protein [Thermomicrobiales bacterium]